LSDYQLLKCHIILWSYEADMVERWNIQLVFVRSKFRIYDFFFLSSHFPVQRYPASYPSSSLLLSSPHLLTGCYVLATHGVDQCHEPCEQIQTVFICGQLTHSTIRLIVRKKL